MQPLEGIHIPASQAIGLVVAKEVEIELRKMQQDLSPEMFRAIYPLIGGVALGVAGICNEGSYDISRDANALCVLVTSDAIQVGGYNLEQVLQPDGMFGTDPDPDPAAAWSAVFDYLESKENSKAALAALMTIGKKNVELWSGAVANCKENGGDPPIIVTLAAKIGEEEAERVGGVHMTVRLPMQMISMLGQASQMAQAMSDMQETLADRRSLN